MAKDDFFAGWVAVVTGAGRGIGLATAEALLAQGARVHLADLNPTVTDRAAELGPHARGHVVDVTDAAAVAALAQVVLERDGRVDLLVNNAGICQAKSAEQLTLEDWKRHLDVNLWGVIHGLQAFLPCMLAAGRGHIANVASMAGLLPFPMVAPYCASKSAVVGLSESLAAELSPRGVRVTVVCPGAVRTDLLAQARLDLTGVSGNAIVRAFDTVCTSPAAQARQILQAVRQGRTTALSPGLMLPLLWLQRASREGYNRLWSTAVGLLRPAANDSEN